MVNNFYEHYKESEISQIKSKGIVMKQHYSYNEVYEMFLDEQHISNYRDACSIRFGKDWTTDSWYASAFFILSIPNIYRSVKSFIKSDGIYFREILKLGTFSSSEYFLLRVAFNLFSDGKERILLQKSIVSRYSDNIECYLGINLSDIVLLDKYYPVFLYALTIRRGSISE